MADTVHTERWVLIVHGDGYQTHIVEGIEALERKFLELNFGPARPATDCTPGELSMMADVLASFRDEDNWATNSMLGRVAFEDAHEDGTIYVYRLTDDALPDEQQDEPRREDGTPYCSHCGARHKRYCTCEPIAESE